MQDDWMDAVPARSLERGAAYYESGRVLALESRTDGWHATVGGSEKYAVIVPRSMDPHEARCSCPHYADGNICKHIAAAMIAIEARGNEVPREAGKESVEDIAARLSAFLVEAVSRDEALERRFRAAYGVADELAHAAELPGGRDAACTLAVRFREDYPRRPALHDELRAAVDSVL